MSDAPQPSRMGRAASWIPSLYFAEGVPCMVVTAVSVVMLKSLGMSNESLAFWTSWLVLPWILKPLWTPLVDLYGTKRLWIVATELAMALAFALAAFSMPLAFATQAVLASFLLLAFLSATHDASADGFYIIALDSHSQATFSGIRSAFYRLAMIVAQGGLVMLAGFVEARSGLAPARLEVSFEASSLAWKETVSGDIKLKAIKLPQPAASQAASPKEELKSLKALVQDWNSPGREGAGPASLTASGGYLLVGVSVLGASSEGAQRQVSFSRISGDKSLSLVEGEILKFDRAGQTRYALIKADPNLKPPCKALFEARSGNLRLAWGLCLGLCSGIFLLLCAYHQIMLPKGAEGSPARAEARNALSEFFKALGSFFQKKGVVSVLAFILLYRFAESQLLKLFAPFMLDSRSSGGLALSLGEQGFIYGTIGIVCLMLGGVAGGLLIARHGLGRWLLPMAVIMNTPDLLFVYLSQAQPEGLLPVAVCVAVEQLGYGFGFTAFMLLMVQFAEDSGPYRTSHYAIMTGFMALGMMLPGMFAGKLQEMMGYKLFFLWVLFCVIPSLAVVLPARRIVRDDFGKSGASPQSQGAGH